MIKVFYTGSTIYQTSQVLPALSLGGYISNTAIPNGMSNAIFPEIGMEDFWKTKKVSNIIGLGLFVFFFDNETPLEKVNLKFEFIENEYNNPIYSDLFKFKFALAPLGGDTKSGFYMEKIANASRPYYLNTEYLELKNNIPVIVNEVSTQGVGIWLVREFNPLTINELFKCDSNFWETNDKIPNISFDFNLNISIVP